MRSFKGGITFVGVVGLGAGFETGSNSDLSDAGAGGGVLDFDAVDEGLDFVALWMRLRNSSSMGARMSSGRAGEGLNLKIWISKPFPQTHSQDTTSACHSPF